MIQTSVNEKISINYIEFNVKDIKQTKAFYQHLGWTFTDFGSSYCEFDSGVIKGGFAQSDTVQSGGGALVILYSDHLEHSLQCVKEAGGTIVRDIFSFPGGRRFHFKDLDDYELAIWSN
ncbi:bleomycin resistance protein [Acinetobacter defluvii]|uniref:VOC family protein n=1 Tax=Acinetobacter defluvii TaxID=1871111 RepID=A0A2S2FDS5_9GAMM|nr:VOC family protein [Acinetobacter defluvii]AWL29126.1 VOC family protein [Acinetobacter defluvii]NNP72240.1 bleomycin resistance protein [Acinetobacter defluvii]